MGVEGEVLVKNFARNSKNSQMRVGKSLNNVGKK